MSGFSWNTADTKESILHTIGSKSVKPIYLLLPGGKLPIEEKSYAGEGYFGGRYAYSWIFDLNFPETILSEADKEDIGQFLYFCEFGTPGIYYDPIEKTYHSFHFTEPMNRLLKQASPESNTFVNQFNGNFRSKYTEDTDGNEVTYNEAIESGVLIPVGEAFFNILGLREVNSLKFSYDKNAVYEDLPVSLPDSNQGYPAQDVFVKNKKKVLSSLEARDNPDQSDNNSSLSP